ncbi:MAG: transcriptional regulator, partial [Parvibaculum sp.]|nr:transcriptional regulator [Parvibaculum sp.]
RLSHPRIVIDTSGLAPQATEAANILAEDIAQMTPAEIDKLLALLKARKRPRRT